MNVGDVILVNPSLIKGNDTFWTIGWFDLPTAYPFEEKTLTIRFQEESCFVILEKEKLSPGNHLYVCVLYESLAL